MSQKMKLAKLASVMHAYPSFALPLQSPIAKDVYYAGLVGYLPILKWLERLRIKIPF